MADIEPVDGRALAAVFDALFTEHGPQHWWPADGPFEVMVGAILTQNTAWTNVERAIDALDRHGCLTARAIVATPAEQLADWIRPAGYFNVKTKRLQHFCRWYLEQGGFDALARRDDQTLRHGLLGVHGVGPETADDILLYAFARPVFVIDAYTRRLFSRLGLAAEDWGYERLRQALEAALASEWPGIDERVARFNEYHALIVAHAKRVCRPRPVCASCCLRPRCPVAVATGT